MPKRRPRSSRQPTSPHPSTSASARKKQLPPQNATGNANRKNKRKRQPRRKRSYNIYRVGPKAFKVATTTLVDIARLQQSTRFLIPNTSFARLLKEIFSHIEGGLMMRIQRQAVEALHTATEMYLTQVFEDSNYLTMHAKRNTLMVSDMALAMKLSGKET